MQPLMPACKPALLRSDLIITVTPANLVIVQPFHNEQKMVMLQMPNKGDMLVPAWTLRTSLYTHVEGF